MSLLINQNSRILVQGITGEKGSFHARQMLNNGAQIVAGVAPGEGGDWVLEGKIPVFDTVDAAVDATGADVSIVFVPVRNVFDALMESISAGIQLIICITAGVPVQDMLKIKEYIQNKAVSIIGPGSPGMITSWNLGLGVIPPGISTHGNIGVVSRSGPLAYEILYQMKQAGIGISSYIGLGKGQIVGTDFSNILEYFEMDPSTEKILLIGEEGSVLEERAAAFISEHVSKPIFGYIAGGYRIVEADSAFDENEQDLISGSIKPKIDALKSAGVKMAALVEDIPVLIGSV